MLEKEPSQETRIIEQYHSFIFQHSEGKRVHTVAAKANSHNRPRVTSSLLILLTSGLQRLTSHDASLILRKGNYFSWIFRQRILVISLI